MPIISRHPASRKLFPLTAIAILVSCATEPAPQPAAPLSAIPDSRRVAVDDRVAGEREHVDPGADGWETEQLSDAVSSRLKEIGQLLTGRGAIDAAELESFVAPGFSCDLLRPAEREVVYAGGGTTVARSRPTVKTRLDGPGGLAESLGSMTAAFATDARLHGETKVIKVTALDDARFDTEILVHLSSESRQQNATWKVEWIWSDHEIPPRMSRIDVVRFDESVVGSPLFTEATPAIVGHEPAYREQFLRGTDDWCARVDFAARMNQYAHNGLAIGDVDNDGLEDVYLCQNGGLPNRLLRQNPDGTVTDVSVAAGVDWLNESRSALFVDLDNDGNQDLVVSTLRDILIMRGDGAARFELVAELPTQGGYSLAAADYDLDGDLDVYVCNYLETIGGNALPSPYHDANNGPPNVLYRNTGGFSFEDATAASGLDRDNRRFSYAASWIDYDEDGDLDLYVANDFGRNNLYRNEDGKFRDVAGEAGVEDMAAGMGTSWGDYDGDGRLDVYVSNMFSSAGRRIAYQRRFNPAAVDETRSGFQRHARGNSLFRNKGDGTFEDATLEADVWMGRWAWGAQFVDLNNDGWEDVFVPNGFFTQEDSHDL